MSQRPLNLLASAGRSLLLFGLLNGSTWANPNDLEADGRMVGRVQLTPQGIEKLVAYSLDKGLAHVALLQQEHPLADITLSPKAEECSEEKLKTMSLAVAWKNCWGIPEVANAWYTSKSWGDFLLAKNIFSYHRPIPTKLTLNAPQLRQLKLGPSQVHCDSRGECQVEIPIERLQIDANLDLSKIEDQRSLFNADGLALTMEKKEKSTLGPRLAFKIRMDQSGRIANALQLDQAKLILADGQIQFTDQTSQQNFLQQAKWINTLMGLSFVRNQIEDALAKNILPGLVTSLNNVSKKLIQEKVNKVQLSTPNLALQDLFDGGKIDKIYAKKILNYDFSKEDPARVQKLANAGLLLQEETFLHKISAQLGTENSIPDYQAFERSKRQINWDSKLLSRDIRDVVQSMRNSSRPLDVQYLLKIQDDLSSFCTQHLQLMNQLAAKQSSIFHFVSKIKIQRSKAKYVKLCQNLRKNLTETLASVRQKQQKREEESLLKLRTELETFTPGKGLELDIFKAEPCPDLRNIHDFAYKNWDRDTNFDLSVQISIDAINLALKKMFEHGDFNFCLNNHEFTTCGNGDADLQFEFKAPPQLKFDPFKGYYLYADKIHSNIKVVGKWKTSDAQKIKMFLKPQALNGKIVLYPQLDISNTTLFSDKDILGTLESLTKVAVSLGTYNMVSNWFINMFVEGNLENIIAQPIGIPKINLGHNLATPGVYIEDINSDRGDHIKIYASIMSDRAQAQTQD